MHIRIRLFAGLKDIAGGDLTETFDDESVTIAELQQRLKDEHPNLEPHLSTIAIAVNEEYILDTQYKLTNRDEVVLIPPISGGSESTDKVPHFLITSQQLDGPALRNAVRTDLSGAVVLFEGVVRNRHEGHEVLRVEYQAYEPMACRQLEAVAQAVKREFPVHDIAIHHRTGTLGIGEISLLVAVSGEHRGETFDAAMRVVDRVKESVPVWKKESTPAGDIWQDGLPARPAL